MKSLKKGPLKKVPGALKDRRRTSLADRELVELTPLRGEGELPLLAQPSTPGVDLADWCAGHREEIERRLAVHGGMLFRGFTVGSVGGFETVIEALSGEELLRYTYRSTPRSEVEGKIYTSTEYPADQHIPMHNEMSYSRRWPMKIWLSCLIPADEGGETPIADSRKVYAAIDPEIRRRFAEQGVMYVRNYGGGLDLSWQDVFGTDRREEVESFCAESDIEVEWRGDDRLRTRQVCQGVAEHPKTGETVWFNQAHLFHVSSLAPAVRDNLLAAFSEDELPRNAYYGDGSPIDTEVLDHVREAFERHLVVFPWQAGDVVVLDNMLAAHGRRPFRGERKVVVGMAEPYQVTG